MAKSDEVMAPSLRGEPWELVRRVDLGDDHYEMQTADGRPVAASRQLMAHAILSVNALQTLDPAVLEMGFSIDFMREHVMTLIKQVAALQLQLTELGKNAADYFEPCLGADAHVRLNASQCLRDQGRLYSQESQRLDASLDGVKRD